MPCFILHNVLTLHDDIQKHIPIKYIKEHNMVYLLAIIALLITFILVPVLIPTLKRMKFGQSIREEGPQSHMKKQVHRRWVD